MMPFSLIVLTLIIAIQANPISPTVLHAHHLSLGRRVVKGDNTGKVTSIYDMLDIFN
jgi:hypothetical protein